MSKCNSLFLRRARLRVLPLVAALAAVFPAKKLRLLLVLFIFSLLSACAGVGVFSTDNPLIKLNDAEILFEQKNRPIIAERLIREAMSIYHERNDVHGLGHANREYGDLLRSSSVQRWEKYYRKNGFMDRSITYDNRTEKASEFYRTAIDYYKKAEDLYKRNEKYDALTNVYLNTGWSYFFLNEKENACLYFDKTLSAYKENMRRNPTAKPINGNNISNMVDYFKKRLSC